MAYNIYLINEDKKEFVRTKTNGEESHLLIKYLKSNIGSNLKVRGEYDLDVENILYTDKGIDYKECDLCDF